MREQSRILKHGAKAALVRGDIDAAFGVQQHLVLDHDAPAVGVEQAANSVDHGGFSGPRPAKQRGDARPGLKREVQREAVKAVRQGQGKRHVPAILLATRRASNSDRSTALTAMAEDISTIATA